MGPLTFFEGGYGVIVRQPIFVTTDNATDTFGIPDPLNPACGAACDYDPVTKEKFWGFVSSAAAEKRLSHTFWLWAIVLLPPDSSPHHQTESKCPPHLLTASLASMSKA